MNSVTLVGRLATDIDIKEVTGGSKVSSFILAVDRNAEEADFCLLHTEALGSQGVLPLVPEKQYRPHRNPHGLRGRGGE